MLYPFIFLFFVLLMLFLLKRYLDWYRKKALYLLFIGITGLFNFSLTHVLVIADYFAFPWRFFPLWVYNNAVYDLFLLPALALLTIVYAETTQRNVLLALGFSTFITLKDLLLIHYTSLLEFHKWTLYHTFIGAFLTFYLFKGLYLWLQTRIRYSIY